MIKMMFQTKKPALLMAKVLKTRNGYTTFLDPVNSFDTFLISDSTNSRSSHSWKGKNSIDNLCIHLFSKDDKMHAVKNLEIPVRQQNKKR